MKILYCKNLWWPFGSHLIHTMQRKRYADMHGYKLLYTQNKHPAYSVYGGVLSELFASISDIDDVEIINFADKNYPHANHNQHFVLKYNENKEFIESYSVDYNADINVAKWHEFKPESFDNVNQYSSYVMKRLAEPSSKVKEYLKEVPFIQEVSKLNGEYVAVHIRWTDKVNGWCTETDFYDVDVYFKHALELREKHGTNNIVLNCDNVEALHKFLSYNIDNKLSFNVLYDKQEELPVNDWKECIFQKWISGRASDNEVFIKDLLNGFKIYKVIFEADSVVCNYFSNMALAPCIARNCNKDVNISNKQPYGIFPGAHMPDRAGMFSQDVKKKRIEGKAACSLIR